MPANTNTQIELSKSHRLSLSKATGRKAAMAVIDQIMGDTGNIHLFKRRMQEAFEIDPYKFYKEIVMPMTPKTNEQQGGGSGPNISINIVKVGNNVEDEQTKKVEATITDAVSSVVVDSVDAGLSETSPSIEDNEITEVEDA